VGNSLQWRFSKPDAACSQATIRRRLSVNIANKYNGGGDDDDDSQY